MAQSYISNYYQMENGNYLQQENKPNWRYQSCECCPYGYHIDLDFVRYCEALKERADYTGSINKRRERRRQRQSMEVLLGLSTSTPTTTTTTTFSTLPRTTEYNIVPPLRSNLIDKSRLQSALVQDALGDVVTDFERVLEKSNSAPTDAVDMLYRVSSNSSMSSGSGSGVGVATAFGTGNTNTTTVNGVINDIDSIKGLSADALKNIRKQMALGLERMRELEEQVKVIPALQIQISRLKDEKQKLIEQIRQNNMTIKMMRDCNLKPMTVSTHRDVAIMCGTITRTIAVGPQYPRTRSVSTTTVPYETNVTHVPLTPAPCLLSQSTQTLSVRVRDAELQTINQPTKRMITFGVNVKPEMLDASLQIRTETKTIGVSNDSIKDTFCTRCSTITRTIGVGPTVDSENYESLSLRLLSVPRSKSFNLGEEKLGLNARSRTIGCQSECFTVNRASQYEPKVSTKACQCESLRKLIHKGVQYESIGVTSQQTHTNDLLPRSKDAFCNTITSPKKDAYSNTEKLKVCDASSNTVKLVLSSTTSSSAVEAVPYSEDGGKREDSTSLASRIPRPFHSPLTERHKLKRQDTYTKLPAPAVSIELSGINFLSTKTTALQQTLNTVATESTSSHTQEKPKHNNTLATNSSTCDVPSSTLRSSQTSHVFSSGNKQTDASSSLPDVPEPALFHAIDRTSRTKAVPSKEMQGAMKVLNDSLQKSTVSGGSMTSLAKSHLKNALNIIQKEWFKISSLINANPLDVEDYLDRFEEMSNVLLQYIVNMTDDSGNTAMHYAVSHGNFDVVSILLDSKVCNINKPNKAGYTSVMLVSLTKIRSPTYATVVRRLFQLADVNVRASQHGQTALMLAVSHGRLDMVQMLLEAGADINIQDEDGSTALMCAAEHGHIDIVKYFLGHPECDSSIVDVDGGTALKIALEAGHKDIGVLLYAHERSVHGISPYSTLKQRKSKGSNAGSTSGLTSRSPSHSALDNKHVK